jgi:hypothetical protein
MNAYFNSPQCMKNLYRQTPQTMQGMYPMSGYPQSYQPTYPSPLIGTTLPTGLPAGTGMGPVPLPSVPPGEISPKTVEGTLYTPGYMKTQIGKKVRVEFLIGSNGTTDRVGTLMGVGASYILIRLEETDDIMLCDLYSIKFVTFYK